MVSIPSSYGVPWKTSLLPKAVLDVRLLPAHPGQELGLLVQHPELKISAESALGA